MTDEFYLRCSQIVTSSNNIFIDFGDNTPLLDVSKLTYTVLDDEYRYHCSHTYEKQGVYKVKVYGKAYWGIMRNSDTNNLLSRCFAADLPVARNFASFASFARCAVRLLYVDFTDFTLKNGKATNASMIFYYAHNLIYAYGCAKTFKYFNYFSQMFVACYNLRDTDFVLHKQVANSTQLKAVFRNCRNLRKDVAKLFPDSRFTNTSLSSYSWFYNATSLYGTVPITKLISRQWWSKYAPIINWEFPTTAISNRMFGGCSDSIRNQLPYDFGGTIDDYIIKLIPDTDNISLPIMKLEYRDNLAATSSTMKFSFERNGYSQKTVNKGAYKYGVTVIIEDSKGNQIFRKRYTREWNGAGLETDDAIIGNKDLYFSLNVGGVYDY